MSFYLLTFSGGVRVRIRLRRLRRRRPHIRPARRPIRSLSFSLSSRVFSSARLHRGGHGRGTQRRRSRTRTRRRRRAPGRLRGCGAAGQARRRPTQPGEHGALAAAPGRGASPSAQARGVLGVAGSEHGRHEPPSQHRGDAGRFPRGRGRRRLRPPGRARLRRGGAGPRLRIGAPSPATAPPPAAATCEAALLPRWLFGLSPR